MKHLSRLFPIFLALAIALLCAIALLPVFNLRSPVGDDPFHYLHQPWLRPFYGLWIALNHSQALNQVVDGDSLQRALIAYRNSVVQEGAVPDVKDLGIDAIADPTRPKCRSLRFTTVKGVVGTLASTTFETDKGAVCRYFPAEAKFSDDRKELTVEVKAYADDLRSDLWIYSVDQSGVATLSRQIEFAKLVLPHAYLADGRLVYRPQNGQLGNVRDAKCALATVRSDQETCLVPESALTKDQRIQAFHRPIGTSSFAILLSTRSRHEIDAYFFPPGTRISFDTPSARDVEHFAVMQAGYIFARVESTPKRYQGVKRFYRQLTPDGSPLVLFEVPVFKTTFSMSGTTAFVAYRSSETGTYALTRLSDAGVQNMSLGGDVEAGRQIQVIESRTVGVPNVLTRTKDRKVAHGEVEPVRGFVEATSLTPMTAIWAFTFNAKSADGTMVPCEFVSPQSAKLPIPAVAVVYGSYGHKLSTGVSPLVNAVLANKIGYLFAHVRGGGELGKEWHEEGRGPIKKMRTVEDFEACIDAAQRLSYLKYGQVLAQGTSAGAIPAAHVALRRPDMVKGAWLDVPYLDSSGRAQNGWRDEMEFGSYSDPAEAAARKLLSPSDQLLIGSDQPGRFLFTCGEYDRVIAAGQCMKGHAVVRAQHPNKDSQFVVLEGKDHYMVHSVSEAQIRNIKIVLAFVLDTLEPPAKQ